MRAAHTVKVAVGAVVAIFLMGLTLAGAPAGAQTDDDYANVLVTTLSQTTAGASCNNTDITIVTSEMLPGSDATFTLFSDPVVLGTVVVADDGTASLTFDLPAGTTLGQHNIVTEGIDRFGEADTETVVLNVTSCAPGGTPGGPGDDALARTGTDVSGPVRIAVLVFAAGAALLLVSRKRQTRSV